MPEIKRPYLRFIGDVHGKLGQYVELAEDAHYSIQVGDLSVGDYKYLNEKKLDPERHKVLAGNHDNYREDASGKFCVQTAHFLGDFGVYNVPNFGSIFYVRGGDSIDKARRVWNKDWWDKEQLSYGQLKEAIDLYKKVKPMYVVTHECPAELLPDMATIKYKEMSPSVTAQALQQMFEYEGCRPAHWIFGHHHQNKTVSRKGTLFRCLAELAVADFPALDIKLE
jgi:hypothetical protein